MPKKKQKITSDRDEVCFIIPVYNEATVVGDVIQSLKKHYTHIVCVDDGSSDNSSEVIKESGAHLVVHPINMGQGAALQTGIEYARTLEGVKYFVMFDADGQHRLEDAQAMIRQLKDKNLDIVLGSRFTGQAVAMPVAKKVVLKLAIQFSNAISGVKLTDTHNGLRVFNQHVADNIHITMSDMAHASEILEIIRRKKFKYAEVPVKIIYSDYSKAKGQSIFNAVNIAFDILIKRISK